MNRFQLFAVVLGFVILGNTAEHALTKAAERYTKVDTRYIGASADSVMVPAYNGATFRPEMIEVMPYNTDSSATCTLTTYIPLSGGPGSATDSTEWKLYYYLSASAAPWRYYGPISDSVRIKTNANMTPNVNFYGN